MEYKINKIHLLIIYIFAVLLYIGTIYAQSPKWVSTEVQNRVAVLEEFTDINWVYSTRGDKETSRISKMYKDQFINIKIHAVPWSYDYIYRNKEIDLSTDEGNTIENTALIYDDVQFLHEEDLAPGSINRSTEPWWQGHAKWMNTVAEIVKQPSIVNIYVKPEINFETRELTVEVEYYYTDDSPVSKNYLTVMLLQNEIICYQAGWNHNQENVINDTLYRHNHALRKIITPGGAWGDTITNTKKGSYECRKYKVTLPDSIKDVPLDFTNLEIIAFIAESKANIYTGHKAIIEVPEDTKTDLALEDITEYYNTLKFETINPKIKVTNNSVLPITKFNIEYTLANNRNTQFNKDFFSKFYGKKIFDTFITKSDTYSGILNKGESVIIELPEITRDDFKVSAYYIAQASFSNIYSDELFLLDTNPTNNTTKTTTKIGLIDTIFSEAEITFENPDTLSNNGLLPVHTVLDKSINPFFSLVQGTIGDLQQELNGAKNSKAAAVFYLDNEYFDVSFKPGYIVFGEIDCKGNPNKILSYYYAYSDYTMNGTRPKIIVEISKDWGKTWQKISEILCEETGKAEKFELRYIPTSEEYKLVQINLYDYAKENFIIRIGGVPGTFGDVLYIDEISITNTSNESIDENTNLLCYPNPATDIIHINNNNLLDKEYEIYDMSGKLIIKDINNTNEINIGNLSTGTYSLKIKDIIFNFIKE